MTTCVFLFSHTALSISRGSNSSSSMIDSYRTVNQLNKEISRLDSGNCLFMLFFVEVYTAALAQLALALSLYGSQLIHARVCVCVAAECECTL